MAGDDEVSACFTIVGSFDPVEITRRLGVEPTEAWRAGDLHSKAHAKREFSRWSLFSRLDRTELAEDHFRDIIAQMDRNPHEFQSVSEQFSGHIQISRFSRTDNQRFHLDRQATHALTKYSLTIGLDFDLMESTQRGDT